MDCLPPPLDPLLRRAALVVEAHHRPVRQIHARHDGRDKIFSISDSRPDFLFFSDKYGYVISRATMRKTESLRERLLLSQTMAIWSFAALLLLTAGSTPLQAQDYTPLEGLRVFQGRVVPDDVCVV